MNLQALYRGYYKIDYALLLHLKHNCYFLHYKLIYY